MQTKIDSFLASLKDKVKQGNASHSERVKLLVSEKSVERQLQLTSDDSKAVEDLMYPLDCAVANKVWSVATSKSVGEELRSARTEVDKYFQPLSIHTERVTVVVARGVIGLPNDLGV